MAFFGFKSKKEVEAEKQQAAQTAVRMAEAANKSNVSNLGRGSKFDFRIPKFDVFDPRMQDTGVPVAVEVFVSYAIDDMAEFLSMNKMETFNDDVFREKLMSGVTKYVKGVVSNVPCDLNIPLVQIERKIIEISEYAQSRVVPQIENVFAIKVRALDITSIEIDKNSRGYLDLKTYTAEYEKMDIAENKKMEREMKMAQHNANMSNFGMQTKMQQDQMMAQHNANMSTFGMQTKMQQDQMMAQHNANMHGLNMQNMQNKMQQDQMMAQHNANMSNFNLQQQMQQMQLKAQSALNLDAMQRQHEMQLGGQEKMQQMQFEMQQKQFDMQQKQMNIQLDDQSEKMRIQREEMQRASRLKLESTFLDAHKANLNAETVNNAMDNGYNPYECQNNSMNTNAGMQQPMMGGMQQPMMGGMQQPMMGGMMGQKTMMGGMQPQVNYMVAVNGQQAGPFNWQQLQQLVQAGQLTRETLVVTNGMTAWLPAGQVQELLPLFQGIAPSMPGMPQMM